MKWLAFLIESSPRFAVRPSRFGAFHLVSVAIIVAVAFVMIIFRRKLPRGERALRFGLALFGVGLLFLEIGKQIVYAYTPNGWDYNWERFPFQFCSTPIYVALIATFLPDGRVRGAFLAFLATYSPVAGFAVLSYPSGSVFHPIIFLNVHTMLWHGAMLLFGLYLWLSEAVAPTLKTAIGAVCVYLPMNFIALFLNEIEHILGFAGNDGFNMFYISRFGVCNIPLLSWVQEHAPYPVFFMSYVLLLGMGGVAVTLGAWAIKKICNKFFLNT